MHVLSDRSGRCLLTMGRKGTISMTEQLPQHRTGGINSHKDTIHVSVISNLGGPVSPKLSQG